MRVHEGRGPIIPERLLGEDFTPNQNRTIGSVDSAHQVFFGDLPSYGRVAVKSFPGKKGVSRAEHEQSVTDEVRERGFKTFVHVGIEHADPGALLVSRHISELVGANTLSLEEDAESEVGISNSQHIGLIACELARLHSGLGAEDKSPLTHGDPQVKNFGFSRLGSDLARPIVFDFEKGGKHGDPENPQTHSAIERDALRLTSSLGYRLYGGPDRTAADTNFLDSVVHNYIEGIDGPVRSAMALIPLQKQMTNIFAEKYQYWLENRA